MAETTSGLWNVYRENSGKFARQMPKSASPLKASRITERSRVLTGPILSTGGIRPSFPISGHCSARVQ